jgi:hypothetical protein
MSVSPGCSVDQKALDFGSAQWNARRRRKFLRSSGQFGPGFGSLRRRRFWQIDQGIAKFIDALPGGRNDPTNPRTAKMRRQLVHIDFQTVQFSGIRHGQGDNDRALELYQLLHEIQSLVEIGRIDNGKNTVRRLGTGHATKDHVDRYLLLERMSAQRVRSRQIDKLDGPVVGLERADMPLDRNARVVADPLP